MAKKVCGRFNGVPLNVKKNSRYADDLWTLKYLPKFKWNNLTEQIVYEQRMRRQRLRAEISQAKRENMLYIKNTEDSKIFTAIERRKTEKKAELSADLAVSEPRICRTFKQRSLKTQADADKEVPGSTNSTISSSIIKSFLC